MEKNCFKLNTGTEVTVVSEEVMEQNSSKKLCGPDQKPLEVLGELYVNLSHKGITLNQPVFIIKQLQKPPRLPAIKALNQLVMVESIEDEISTKYPSLFTGLGTFPDACSIKLSPDAKLYNEETFPFHYIKKFRMN